MIKNIVKKLIQSNNNKSSQENKQQDIRDKDISDQLEKNITAFKSLYNYPNNLDIEFRSITIGGLNKKAALLFITTITDTHLIDDHIIQPLLDNITPNENISNILSTKSVSKEKQIKQILMNANNGSAVLLIDGFTTAFIIDVADFKERNIEKAENEMVLKGPKEAFTEGALTNISLIRRKIKDEDLTIEKMTVGTRSQNDVFVMYINDIANEKLVDNIKERIGALDVSFIQNLAMLEQYIEERPYSLFSSILHTERPDRTASLLENGHIVLLMDNSPSSLILPATMWTFFHTAEDDYLRFFNGNFIRFIRLLAIFLTMFISAIYVSLTEYHTEMIPEDLLLAIATTREKVPFPPIIEILLMEIAFELIREAGLRVPAPIGPTIGIVGALILGQAAVEATIVSPIVVIVVALGGLSSFAIGNLSLNFSTRISRFLYIIAASFFGFYGMVALYTVSLFYIVSLKSFGVPYLAPFTPTYKSSEGTFFKKTLQSDLFRPGYLKPKDMTKK